MHSFISPTGEVVKTKTLREFTTLSGMKMNCARSLSCGRRSRNHGWFSTHPKTRRQRDRFFTVLVNTVTGEKMTVGDSIKSRAKEHGLGHNALVQLVNGHRFIFRHWMLEKTLKIVDRPIPASHF